MTNPSYDQPPQLAYSYERFAFAKAFFFRKWCELAVERKIDPPVDLSGACKYGSLFVNLVFGGCIRGHYEHQYNVINNRIVDLSHDALDVGRINTPYLHEPEYFNIPEKQAALAACLPRVEPWAAQFLLEVDALEKRVN